MNHADIAAELISVTGWTLETIGNLTPRQLATLMPALYRAVTGEKQRMSYSDACRIAGVKLPPNAQRKMI